MSEEMLCWDCGYILFGLDSRRCPECGRPFDPGDESTFNRGFHGSKKWAAPSGTILTLYPITVVASLYCTWIAGRLALGRWPRPMLDDLYPLGAAVNTCYLMTFLLSFLLPPVLAVNAAFLLIGITYISFRWGTGQRLPERSFWLLCIVPGATSVGCLLLLWWDPLRVLVWFFN